ncbi:MAG: DUF692 family protein [Myxococcales bacterium]|nr:DUF692 family protein [Myxococcales bacterium]
MTPPPANRWGLPDLGLGLGLRTQHIETILAEEPDVGWFEVITENALHHRGWYRSTLARLRERYPIVLHGVSLSIGSADPLDMDYLKQVKALADELAVPWLSDHVCWTGVRGQNSHDLLPVPYDEATLAWMVARIRQVQDVLERPLMLENPSSYAEFSSTTLTEWDFIAEMAERADCGLLLDVNNIYVSAINHHFDPMDYLAAIPWDRVTQFHVAGHTNRTSHLFDSHIGPVIEPVWELLRVALARSGGRATMLEWDDEIPDFDVVWQEAKRAEPWIAEVRAHTSQGAPTVHSRPFSSPSGDADPSAVHHLQTWFLDAITGQTQPTPTEIKGFVLANDKMTAQMRLTVYERMVSARLHEAMQEDFPATLATVGSERFGEWVTAYLRAHPSHHWALERLGADFAGWIARSDASDKEQLSALAALEWQLVTTGWEPWQAPVTAGALATVPPDRYGDLILHKAQTTWLGTADAAAVQAIASAWESRVEGAQSQDVGSLDAGSLHAGSLEPAALEATSLGDDCVHVVIYRAGWTVDIRTLSTAEAAVLEALLCGAPLGDAVVKASERGDAIAAEIAASLGQWTQRWVADQVVTGLSLAEPTPA